jgi:NAD(P)-dependent dehydrogenase (short-subunit alcohol dehydrogenase family)
MNERVLHGKVAVVTGGGAGLGRGIADALAAAGADVAIAEIDGDAADRAASQIAANGVRTRAYVTDVGSSEQVDRTFGAIASELGSLDIVVNNAGIVRTGPHTHEVTDRDWHDSIAVLQTGVFFGMRAAGRIMIEQGRGGSVINIASIRGFSPNPGRMTYSPAKAAVIMMTRVAAGEWGPHDIRVNAIAPGVMHTDKWDLEAARGLIDEPFYLRTVPARRLGQPHEVGQLAVYLASDTAAYVSGACIPIDGGLTSIPAG